ncbi:MAG: phenylalanine--tRNA ligase subunit beta, partial [Microbacteriaceae bacterium]
KTAADGGADVRGIVCGASNFSVGDKVVVCLPGAVLPGGFAIAARSTYGHISDGMLASGRELGLNDNHDGILILQNMGLDPKVGSDALELLNLDDQAAEVNVTPDRGYCFSIRGVAREYSHATSTLFRDPMGHAHPDHAEGFALAIDDVAPIRGKLGCDRFSVRAVLGVDPAKPTPAWMVSRLKLAGMRSISLIVDITNYVMLELGQPLHAYDLDKLKGGITVRRAKVGETLKTLDGQVRKLHVEDLLITDESGAIGLAGVMGGESTEVTMETRNVLIEAAHFDPITIARSARRHKLPSEASKRFERGVDTAIGLHAIARVVQLLEVHAFGAGDRLGGDLNLVEPVTAIDLPLAFAESLVGVAYTEEEIVSALETIGCQVESREGADLSVTPPTWRPDLKHKTDLVEEIARINGYERIGARLPVAPPGRGLTREQKLRRNVSAALVGASAVEVLNYPFLSTDANRWFRAESENAVRLANPIQEDAPELRLSLLPGLMQAAKRNIDRGFSSVALFEEGSVFLPSNKVTKTADLPSGTERPSEKSLKAVLDIIPEQPRMVAAVFLGDRIESQVGVAATQIDYSDAISAATALVAASGASLVVRQAVTKGFHAGRTAELLVQTETSLISFGFAGELDPQLTAANDLPRRVAALEVNLDKLFAAAPQTLQAKPIFTYPAATQDLSLLVPRELAAGSLQALIMAEAGELLEEVRLVDDYRGENVASDKKSLTFALRFRASDRTLTQAEASEAKNAAVAAAQAKFGAELRA